MPSGERLGSVLQELGRAFKEGSVAGMGEGQLLRRFAADGDEIAFSAIVARHGPMVLGVCRRVLADPNDVDDAFQATFLVLARKAGSLRDAELVGPWLFGVASRVSARARSDAARRLARESSTAQSEALAHAPDDDHDELRRALDDEINRLPEKYRRPVVLCYVQGQSHEEAARRLRCTTGSLRGRLDRARTMLRSRLTRRGFAPAVAVSALASATDSSAAAVPAALLTAAVAVARGSKTPAVKLADATIRSMHVAGVKILAGAALLAAVPLAFTLALALAGAKDNDEPPRTNAPSRAVNPAGSVSVTGRVLTAAGQPIASARVASGSNPEQGQGSETVTDADGRFAFPGVEAAELIVTVQARGYAPELKRIAAERLGEPVEFRLGLGRTVRGQIVDLDGKPIAGAPVSVGPWRGAQSLRWSSTTDAEGRYRWHDAPADDVLVDLGTLGYSSKRFVTLNPDGPERSVGMPRPLFVRGSVTDAETGRPIEAFTVLTGMDRQWDYDRARRFEGGTYELKLGAEYSSQFVRIEAEGYRPETSPEYSRTGSDPTFHVKLHRETGIAGTVRQPNGAPLAGADVVIAAPKRHVWIKDRRPQDRRHHQVVMTGPDGRFSFPRHEPPYTVVALHEKGVAQQTFPSPAAAHELTIQPWGRVEGTLRIGSRPGAGELLVAQHRPAGDPRAPTVSFESEVKADGNGHFAFQEVVPGETVISRSIRLGPLSREYTHRVQVTVAPGMVASVTVGGSGRPVLGRINVPANVAGQVDWLFSQNYIRRQPPKLNVPEGLGLEARRQWFAAWSRSPEGQASRRRQEQTYAVIVRPDGSFRVEDVDAGAYELVVLLDRPPADPTFCAIGGERLAQAIQKFEVPAMDGGRSDEPLDIGTIALEPKQALRVVNVAELAPQFQAESLDGKTMKLADYRGRYVLLDFWATWCGPCVEELPHLKAAFEAFGKDERFAMFGLSLDELSATPRAYAAEHGLAWTHAFLGEWSKTTVPQQFGIWGIPSIWLIGPDGTVIAKDLRGARIKSAVAEALASTR